MKVSKYINPNIIQDGSIDGDKKIKEYPPLKKGSGYKSVSQKECSAPGYNSHAEGITTESKGQGSHAEGAYALATNFVAHAEGYGTTASGQHSHAEGESTRAVGDNSHAEGSFTTASGRHSHAEGESPRAVGNISHAEGNSTIAQGACSHAEGDYTETYNRGEHAEGRYNISRQSKTIHTVGIGNSVADRKNAEEIHADGKKYVYGIGGYDGTNSETTKTVQEVVAEAANTVQITYTELKSLRDSGTLVPGQQYRITDYTCTTTQSGTKSAGHVFDIIVTADDESTLNEVARAVKHKGDTYFADSDLNAWKIWYCLDNDANRFAWADKENGKGVIYRMIDEWSNDVPYDFKNIQFYRKWDADKSLWSTIPSYNTGVPCYTFSSIGSSSTTSFTDYSLASSNSVYSNVIGKYVSNKKQTLNNNCFFVNSCHSNTFGNDCNSNTFGNDCNSNTFGNNCAWNIFGHNCNNNTFGNYCNSNTFGNYCDSNTFGNKCYSNTFGFSCSDNSFGNNCYNNTFGNNCVWNIFGNGCQSNTFGSRLQNNTFGNGCDHIKFASDSSATTKYAYYQNNHFGDGCQYILFKGEGTASYSQRVQNYNFAQGLQGTDSAYLTIDGVRGRSFETKVAKKSNGELKIYCEADLIL